MVLNRKTRSRRNYKPNKQRGGFVTHSTVAASKMPMAQMPMAQMPMAQMPMTQMPMAQMPMGQKGGSPASSILMNDATMNPPVMNDYITSPRIRDSWYNDSLSALEPKCGGQAGGSLASDLVTEQLTQKGETKPYDAPWSPKGDMNSLNLYETTGGARRRRHRKTKGKSKKRSSKTDRKSKRNSNSKRNNRQRSMRGGGSDWITSQYSLGPYNNPEQPASWVSQFSQSTATPRADYMNPPTMGLAGSGYPMGSLEGANVSHVGAPLV